MPLIKGGKIVADPWRHVGDDEALPAEGPVIVSLTRWRVERDSLRVRIGPIGVRLAADEPPAGIANDLDLVAINQSYRVARRCRSRHSVQRLECPAFIIGKHADRRPRY